VLVADEAPLVRWAVRRALGAAGFRIIEAETRAQVLEALVSRSFRLVVLSLTIAGDDMEDIGRAIAAPAGTAGLILLTENGLLPDGVVSHSRVRTLDKPFSVAALVSAAVSLVPDEIEPAGDSLSL
jgi:DNA-binding NtrC family response regulator